MCDVVFHFVEQITDGEFGGDFRDGKTGRLRRERGGTRHARVHLDDDHAAIVGVDAELDVRAARFHADRTTSWRNLKQHET